MDAPVIIQVYEHNIGYRGFEYFVKLVTHLARTIKIPYAISLDHGNSVTTIMQAVKAGFTGVMMDNGAYSLDGN
jgi:fructose/tagatose bisphosphate aldolase